MPDLEYSSYRYYLEVEADSYEQANKLLSELEEKELITSAPDYIQAADKLASLKNFLTKLSAHPKLWPEVRIEWQKYLDEKRSIHNQ